MSLKIDGPVKSLQYAEVLLSLIGWIQDLKLDLRVPNPGIFRFRHHLNGISPCKSRIPALNVKNTSTALVPASTLPADIMPFPLIGGVIPKKGSQLNFEPV